MASMGDIEAEALAAVRRGEHRIEGLFHRNADAAHETPAPGPVTLAAAPPKENPVTMFDTLRTHVESDVAEIEAKLKGADEEALGWLSAVAANPEAKAALSDLAGLASIVGLPVGTISGVVGGIKTVLSLYAQQAQAASQGDQASFTPAAPVVGGQA